ncbi:hypothetical protein A2Z22_04415 [Candidatus Woesebacteria bacterium RBG_16_34_12]|uniref:Uncharacterized protein n=1 Tax=Candidatus Woesebacteria bacterium RBG_16_34_12 TaxID=1802480 RepID=A0A1F7XBT0_9BACT|nr:MAG: hypothetical protein A2Z22_04415 [Candidatus Woesebacteria bacterium RBG_16_34_12]
MIESQLDELRIYLDREDKSKRELEQDQENVRQELEERGRRAIEKYRLECEELEPLTEEKVVTVIQPWFDKLQTNGTYDQLLGWLETHGEYDLSVSSEIQYYWPDKAFQSFRGGEERPFDWLAKYIVGKYRDYRRGIEEHHPDINEKWKAFFKIENRKYVHQGLLISRWPVGRTGFGFAVGRAKRLEIPVYVEDISEAIPSIHPRVWIGFAEQIENGTAQEILESSLKPKHKWRDTL